MADPRETGAKLRDKVEEEAAAAEAETPEEEPEAEPASEPEEDEDAEAEEPVAEPEPQGRRQRSPQDRFQAAFSRFVKTAAECFEITPQEVVVAPYDGVVGIMLPGFTEPRTNENYRRCETCNGRGKVLTGAITGDDSKDWHVCPDKRCKGQGYWSKDVQPEQRVETGPLAVTTPPAENGEWGEAPSWLGDPNLTPVS